MPRLAASVALRMASGTSRALPWPKPTRPFWSPTTTRAAKPKRRPPFTTLATRLICTSLSTNSPSSRSRSRSRSRAICCSFDKTSELEPALARRIGERLDPAVEQIAPAVEHDVLDPLGDGALGDELADRLGGRLVGAGLETVAQRLLERGGRRQRLPLGIVDHLCVDVFGGAVHR